MKIGGLQRHRSGVVLGTFFALVHLGWTLLVTVRLSDEVANFVFRTHFLTVQHATFRPDLFWAVAGLITAFASGYIAGTVLAFLWNRSYNHF